MSDTQHYYKTHCPINYAQESFGDRWSLLIIRDMMFYGKRYYGDFLKSAENMSTNILADRLGKLTDHGIICKTLDKQNHSKYIYSLTKKGVDLLPILLETIAWAAKYDAKTEAPTSFVSRLKNDRASLVREILGKLKNQGK